jgi:osmotically-inducible protein OsmY
MLREIENVSNLDRELERRVSIFLGQKHFAQLRRVKVESQQGVITIRGRVKSFHERQLCISCCQRVAGVRQVRDELEVTWHPSKSAPPVRLWPAVAG